MDVEIIKQISGTVQLIAVLAFMAFVFYLGTKH